jgi:hypothetical protein
MLEFAPLRENVFGMAAELCNPGQGRIVARAFAWTSAYVAGFANAGSADAPSAVADRAYKGASCGRGR